MGANVFARVLVAGLLGASAGANAASNVVADLAPALPAGWSFTTLPGAGPGVALAVLKRQALFPPARYRVLVLPGSGCTGWVPVAERYFAGLLHAELLVLHKPGVDVGAGLAADCTPDFVQHDTLSAWRDHAQAALRAHYASVQTDSQLPVLLLGISEGAELLPYLTADVPALAGLVMLSAPGLDPRESGELQAQRLGQWPAWLSLERAQASAARDDEVHEGRTLKYWRDFWHWQLAQPLLDAPWPLLRVWGDADALVPLVAYERFTQQSRGRVAPMCDVRLPGADHGLQSGPAGEIGPRDGLQWLWARLEVWARNPAAGLCLQVSP